MRSDCTHLMFIDSDIGFNANDVIAISTIQYLKSKNIKFINNCEGRGKACF